MKAPILLACALALAGCAERSLLSQGADTGAHPALPEPNATLIPTVKVAPAKGWPAGTTPKAAAGTRVVAFAENLDHPRWVAVLPNGDVLVAETAAPPRPEDSKGPRAKVMGMFMKKAGSAVKSANRITLLRDADGDGVAETRHVFLEGLNSPFGMALIGNQLYVANTDAVLRFPYEPGLEKITVQGQKIADLPAGPRNHHWTKNLIASLDGLYLYVTAGSNSNVAEHGMEEEAGRAAIWEIDLNNGRQRVIASGLRNPNGMGWEPRTKALWTVVNERDELGSDLVPDYLTSVRKDGFYGWPYSYYGSHVDTRVPARPDMVAKSIKPDYALGNHVAPLGLAFSQDAKLPFGEGAYVGQHGSWNRRPPSGYNVVFIPFSDGKPSGKPVEVLGGFLNDKGEAQGRPVGVAIDRRGALLVADDVGNKIWRVSASQ